MKKDNFELSKDIEIIKPNDIEILDANSIDELSLEEYQKAKEILDIRRKQMALKLDGQKLHQALKVVNNMDMILDRMMPNYYEEGEYPSASDLRALAEAYERQLKSLNMLARMDTLDSSGSAARISIKVEYK